MLHRLWKIADFTKKAMKLPIIRKKQNFHRLFKICRFCCSFCKIGRLIKTSRHILQNIRKNEYLRFIMGLPPFLKYFLNRKWNFIKIFQVAVLSTTKIYRVMIFWILKKHQNLYPQYRQKHRGFLVRTYPKRDRS